MKIFFRNEYLAIFIFFLVIISCRQVHTYEGRAIIISRSVDSTLKDSALIYGFVNSAVDGKTPEPLVNILVEGTNIKTKTDGSGLFNLKLPEGNYSLKCYREFSENEMFEELKNISLLPNEKIQVEFSLGITVE